MGETEFLSALSKLEENILPCSNSLKTPASETLVTEVLQLAAGLGFVLPSLWKATPVLNESKALPAAASARTPNASASKAAPVKAPVAAVAKPSQKTAPVKSPAATSPGKTPPKSSVSATPTKTATTQVKTTAPTPKTQVTEPWDGTFNNVSVSISPDIASTPAAVTFIFSPSFGLAEGDVVSFALPGFTSNTALLEVQHLGDSPPAMFGSAGVWSQPEAALTLTVDKGLACPPNATLEIRVAAGLVTPAQGRSAHPSMPVRSSAQRCSALRKRRAALPSVIPSTI